MVGSTSPSLSFRKFTERVRAYAQEHLTDDPRHGGDPASHGSSGRWR
jgi:hypothetical protein